MTDPAFRSLPDADSYFTVTMSDGAVLPVYGVSGPMDGPVLLFGHANGLAAGSYGPWLRLLARRARVFAFDARGHGGATWPEGALPTVFAIDRTADDLAAIVAAVMARVPGPFFYAGHSLGAVCALELAARGDAMPWESLVLFEPPVFPTPDAACYGAAEAEQPRLVAGTLRRRADWASPEAFYDRLKTVPNFARFRDDMLRAHCHATLRPKPEGGFTLACPPAVESCIYETHRTADTWQRVGRIAGPVDIVGGDPAMPGNDWISGAMPELAARLPRGRLAMLDGTSHMLILEAPERCAALVLDRLGCRD